MRRVWMASVAVVALAALSGCGFHLRGKVELPPSLATVYVVSTDPELQVEIEQLLRMSGATPAAADSGATAILKISDVRYERTVRSVDTRGKATAYLLSYTVGFSVADPSGKSLLDPQTVRVKRDFNYDSTQVLVKEGEEQYLRRDMRRDVAQQMLRRLAAIQGRP